MNVFLLLVFSVSIMILCLCVTHSAPHHEIMKKGSQISENLSSFEAWTIIVPLCYIPLFPAWPWPHSSPSDCQLPGGWSMLLNLDWSLGSKHSLDNINTMCVNCIEMLYYHYFCTFNIYVEAFLSFKLKKKSMAIYMQRKWNCVLVILEHS